MFARGTINAMKRRVTKRIYITRRFRPTALTVVVGLFAVAGFIALRASFAQTTQPPQAAIDAVTPNDPTYGEQPIWKRTHIDELWSKTTGSPDVTIALVGFSISPHQEFEGRLLPGWDAQTGKSPASTDTEAGTAIAGLAAAKGNNALGGVGACWNCKLMPVTVYDSKKQSDSAKVSSGIHYAVDNGAKVIGLINVSNDRNGPDTTNNAPLRDAIKYANSKNVLVIVKTTYDTTNPTVWPAAYPTVLAPSAVNDDGTINEYNSYPKYVDLAIPESNEVPTPSNKGTDQYGSATDSNVALGFTMGVAGLLYSAYPKATQTDIFNALKTTTTACCQGKIEGGLINVPKAVEYLEAKYPTSTTPTPTPPTPTPPTPTPPTPTPPTPNPPSSGKAGDLNGDNKVNLTDLSLLLSAWGKADTKADLNKNGKVDLPDLSILLSNWGK